MILYKLFKYYIEGSSRYQYQKTWPSLQFHRTDGFCYITVFGTKEMRCHGVYYDLFHFKNRNNIENNKSYMDVI
jgi:hypothetical protein